MIVHEGHEGAVNSVAFSPDGKSVASGSDDNTIRTWETHNASAIGEPLRGHGSTIWSVAYSPLGSVIASSGSNDQTIRLWDVNTRRQLGEPIMGDHYFFSVAFSPDAKLIVSGGYNPSTSTVQLWDVQNRTLASAPFDGHTNVVYSVQFSPDGTRVVSGSADKTIRVWDVERNTTILGPIEGHTGSVRSTCFSPDGSKIVSGSDDRTIRLWDVRSGEMIGNPYKGHTSHVCSVDFSPRGTYVVSGGDDTVRLWDTRTGRQVDQPYQEHTNSVWSVAFSPCGQYVASGSSDGQVIIRSVSCDYPELPDDLALDDAIEDDDPLLENGTTPAVSAQMSTQQIFDCLIAAGCIDLSSQMDSKQDTAMIVSGGGFGDIWMGQLHDGQKVAIKAWRTDAMEQCRYKTLKRAARELFYWSRMQHKNIHQLMGVILFKDRYLGMVSEWMVNGDLHKYIRENPRADRYRLCLDVASGLEYMHSQSTVHGDLKAANILVSSDGTARLSDFDFSVMSDVSALEFTQTSNNRSGSTRWLAPEMLVEEASKRTMQSDVYALGMTMLEIFTGEVPYPNRQKDHNVIMTVIQGTLPTRPINQLTNKSGDIVWSMLLKCWSRNLEERPSAGQVVETLEPHVRKT